MLNNRDPIGDSRHWALCRTHYFDVATQRFRCADIEFGDGRIVAVLPPGASGTKLRIDGSHTTCLPGFIGEIIVDDGTEAFDWPGYLRAALMGGVTTVNLMTDRPTRLAAYVRAAGVRARIFCGVRDQSLGCPQANKDGHDEGSVERAIDAHCAVDRSLGDRLTTIAPAITSQSWASSRLTVRLHALAHASGKRLLVNVDSGGPRHSTFRDAYGCSGMSLLRSLDVLDGDTIALIDDSLSKHDLAVLRGAASAVGIADFAMLANETRAARTLRAILRSERGSLLWRRSDARAAPNGIVGDRHPVRWASLPEIGDVADIAVAAMTHRGAWALGLPAIGRIEAGARADLAIYDAQVATSAAQEGQNAHLLLAFITAHRPRIVMIDGHWRVRDGDLV